MRSPAARPRSTSRSRSLSAGMAIAGDGDGSADDARSQCMTRAFKRCAPSNSVASACQSSSSSSTVGWLMTTSGPRA